MSIDHFVSRFWRVASIIAFGITLLFTYRGLPDPTAVHFGESGRGDGFLPKEEIFYLLAAVVTFINVLILLLIKNIQKVPVAVFEKIFTIFQSKGGELIQKILCNWVHFLAAGINTFLLLALRILLLLNDERTFDADYSYLPWVGYLLIAAWILYFPFRLVLSADFKEK